MSTKADQLRQRIAAAEKQLDDYYQKIIAAEERRQALMREGPQFNKAWAALMRKYYGNNDEIGPDLVRV